VIDLIEVEKELCRIPEVSAARIVADATGRPTEVHILASTDKHAKQLVRDVQSVAIATFGLEIDRRVISVVQLDTGSMKVDVAEPDIDLGAAEATSTPSPRPSDNSGYENGNGRRPHDPSRILVDRVAADRDGIQCHVEVTLRRGDEMASASVTGSSATAAVLRSVAMATLVALRDLEPAAERADLETASIIRLGERSLAVASIVLLVPPYEEVVSGSAIVRGPGDHDAMARAVLDATNRRLAQLR
jgi:hypothetical protein